MNVLIKEKEDALEIDINTRARPFCPVGIEKFYKPNRNAENKAENITNSYEHNTSQNTPKPDASQWVKVITKGITKGTTKDPTHDKEVMNNHAKRCKTF